MRHVVLVGIVVGVIVVSIFSLWRVYHGGDGGKYSYVERNPDHVTVMVSMPLALESAQSLVRGIQMALDTYGDQSSVPIEIEVIDTGNTKGSWLFDKEVRAARIASERNDVVAYIGPFGSDAATASMPILNVAGIAQISPTNTWPGLTKIGFRPGEPGVFYPTGVRHYMRVVPTDDVQAPAAALWARELGVQSVVILHDGEPYGKGLGFLFKDKAEMLGMDVLDVIEVRKGSKGEGAIEAIVEVNPDLVFLSMKEENHVVEMVHSLREQQDTMQFMATRTLAQPSFIEALGADSEGLYVTSVGIPPRELASTRAVSFSDEYYNAFNEEPDVLAPFGYDAMHVIVQAVINARSASRADILRELREVRDFEGTLGKWGFDINGDTTLRLVGSYIVQEGELVYQGSLSTQ